MRIAFLGTPDFAVPSLQMLIERGEDVVMVFTQPDRPKGRGYATIAPPVKALALEHGLPICQTPKIRAEEGQKALEDCAPELMITAAFGQILSKENLCVPKYGCINVHASLLPKFRGAAPIQWAIISGEKTTGITTMMTDEGLDTGDILLQRAVSIGETETAGELSYRLAILGAQVLCETLDALKAGTLVRTPQSCMPDQPSFVSMLKKQHGHINFAQSCEQVFNFVRGVDPWPGAYTLIGDKPLKIWRVRQVQGVGGPGTVLAADARDGLVIACAGGAVQVLELQVGGGKRMDAQSYLRGARIPVGTVCS